VRESEDLRTRNA
jgi:hypothetical protein